MSIKNAVQVWEVDMYKNWGTVDVPDIRWGTDTRYYFAEKTKDDFDLKDIEGLRKNATKKNKTIGL